MARIARAGVVVALVVVAACGPGAFASDGESGSSETDDTGETGDEGGLPPLPEMMGCLERGGSPTLVDAGKPVLEGYPEYAVAEDLVATDEALLAMWRVGFNGSNPMPNVFLGVLDDQRELVGPPALLREEPATAGPRAHRDANGLILSLCARWGAVDRATTMRLGLGGEILVEPIRREPDDRNCGIAGHVPDAIWIGNGRYLSAHRDNSSGPVEGYELLVDRFNQAGDSLDWDQIQDDGDWRPEPRFVASEEAVFLVSTAAEPDDGVVLHRFDQAGNWLPNEQVELELPPGVPRDEIALAANAEGIVLWMEGDPLPWRWQLDPLGQPLVGPVEVELEPGGVYEAFEIERRPGGFALVGVHANWGNEDTAILIAWLDEAGAVLWTTELAPPEGSEPGYVHGPALSQRGDSTYVLWQHVRTVGVDLQSTDLLVTEVACVE